MRFMNSTSRDLIDCLSTLKHLETKLRALDLPQDPAMLSSFHFWTTDALEGVIGQLKSMNEVLGNLSDNASAALNRKKSSKTASTT